MTTLSLGFGEVLTSAGNAYVYSEQPDGDGSNQLYETNLGVSAGVDPIDGDDAVDARALGKAAAGGGLAVSGTTNAPAGATIAVQLFGASADTNTLNSPVVLGTADGLGHWTATVPVALLQAADGNYALVVQVGLPTGNSFFSVRDFIVDTKAPDAPDAPKLDAGSDTSLASDGSATSHDLPVLTPGGCRPAGRYLLGGVRRTGGGHPQTGAAPSVPRCRRSRRRPSRSWQPLAVFHPRRCVPPSTHTLPHAR